MRVQDLDLIEIYRSRISIQARSTMDGIKDGRILCARSDFTGGEEREEVGVGTKGKYKVGKGRDCDGCVTRVGEPNGRRKGYCVGPLALPASRVCRSVGAEERKV